MLVPPSGGMIHFTKSVQNFEMTFSLLKAIILNPRYLDQDQKKIGVRLFRTTGQGINF